ncbi:ER to Golgi protein transport [Ophiocordyceps camponoti-floridani]|uniref:ER to Golgi protein transport n=1 Tax=Ophiocordyceps camponoti-floridani TaxID=2030778 RepID=A0A8H4VC17_9HYPO|nr:ER to Golgi protein transport [Ophiocordyceps camponoti-floridani]
MSIRAEALLTCGDMIRDAKQLQESFAQFTIPYTLALEKADAEEQEVYVIDGLLDLILSVHDLSAFDLRYAACECLKAARDAHDALEKSHIADVREMKKQQLALETIHKKYMLSVEEKIAAKDAEHQLNIIEAQKVAQDDAERARVRAETEIAQLKAQITKINQESSSKINELQEENYRLNVRHTADMSAAETRIHELEKQLSSVESRCQDLVRGAETLQKEKLDALKISAATQSELDDLLVVFSDMEDRLAKYETTDEVSV